MPSFQDSLVLFVIALLLFGPKKLPVLARELGKWIGEFRRASNEFKMQMEEELRAVEQADRQKQIAAMEAAAPIAPALAELEHPHVEGSDGETGSETGSGTDDEDDVYGESEDNYNYGSSDEGSPSGGESSGADSAELQASSTELQASEPHHAESHGAETHDADSQDAEPHDAESHSPEPAADAPAAAATPAAPPVDPLPIATSGELNLMPPATGLPVGRSSGRKAHGSASKPPPPEDSSPLGGLFDSIPSVSPESAGSARMAQSSQAATSSSKSKTSSQAAPESSPALANSEALTESETHVG